MTKTLRPYQQKVVDDLKRRLKETINPLLLNISVGGGKSLIIAELLLWLEKFEYRALCLTLNSTLIKQNANAYKLQGGRCGIYCAGLKSKSSEDLIIFASPHSVCQDIKHEGKISRQPFNLIVIDEAHNVNFHDETSMFMRIWQHYYIKARTDGHNYRIVGLTGTPYRGKGEYIVGPDQFFKEELATISAPWLIEQGYLTKPTYGITYVDSIDFSDVHVENTGKFRHKDLEDALSQNERLTGEIMREVVDVLNEGKHHGAFIFAATIKHCDECLRALPEGQAAIITGDTPHDVREKILMEAQAGRIKYLISVNCLMVGVDVPAYDICVWCRPTESLILYIQGIGRVLRLSPGKDRAVVLDYAGNIERHGDIDNPIINEAINNVSEDDPDYCIPCYVCNTNNKVTARRCRGVINKKRCEHFFEWKECPGCETENDITARHCRNCQYELIDPNAKLEKIKPLEIPFTVATMNWRVHDRGYPFVQVEYKAYHPISGLPHSIYESYYVSNDRAANVFYGNFIKKHFDDGHQHYNHLQDLDYIRSLFQQEEMIVPRIIECVHNDHHILQVKRKIFD
jgi:DNA repair protein RadD